MEKHKPTQAEHAKPASDNDKQIVNVNVCDMSLTNHLLNEVLGELECIHKTIKLLIPKEAIKFTATRSAVREQ